MTRVTYYLRSGQKIVFWCKSITVGTKTDGSFYSLNTKGARKHVEVALSDIAAIVF